MPDDVNAAFEVERQVTVCLHDGGEFFGGREVRVALEAVEGCGGLLGAAAVPSAADAVAEVEDSGLEFGLELFVLHGGSFLTRGREVAGRLTRSQVAHEREGGCGGLYGAPGRAANLRRPLGARAGRCRPGSRRRKGRTRKGGKVGGVYAVDRQGGTGAAARRLQAWRPGSRGHGRQVRGPGAAALPLPGRSGAFGS